MSQNIEDLKNKIIYRASYRGTKEMDVLMINFIRSIINDLSDDSLKTLDRFVNMDDEKLMSLKKNEALIDSNNNKMKEIINKFKKFEI